MPIVDNIKDKNDASYQKVQDQIDANTIYKNLHNRNGTNKVLPDEDVRVAIQNVAKRKLYSEGIATNFKDLYSFLIDGTVDARSEYFDVFNRYKTIFPGDEISGTKTYIFIVRPDLNMPWCIENDMFYQSLFNLSPNVIRALTHSESKLIFPTQPKTHFIPFLFDRVTQYGISNFEVKNYTIEQPYTSFKTTYAGNSNESRTGVNFTIEFRESGNFDVIKMFEAWVRYIDMVTMGANTPFNEYIESRMLYGVNIIDYATSVYMFVTKADGMEIVYWNKMTGAFPTGVPHSNFSYNEGGDADRTVSIDFCGGMPEAFNPRIFVDFNYNAGLFTEDPYGKPISLKAKYRNGQLKPVPHARIGYESERGGSPIVGGPYICFDKEKGTYLLKWREIE